MEYILLIDGILKYTICLPEMDHYCCDYLIN